MELNQQTKQENRERSGPVAWMRIWIKEKSDEQALGSN